jgi:hypothetical protein
MLDLATQKKYLRILSKGNILKLDASDAIGLVEKFDDLVWEDQLGNSTRSEKFKECMGKIKGKVVLYFFTLYSKNETKILYWSPCSIEDIISIAGGSDYKKEDNIYESLKWISREEQLSFLGKDIKKACRGDIDNNLIKVFYDKYINTNHPIADNIFYTVYIKKDNGEQSINCARNTTLSPRPEKSDTK